MHSHITFCAFICLFLGACQSERATNPLETQVFVGTPIFETNNVVIKEGVRTFGGADGLLFVKVEENRLIYEFTADKLPEINVGNILVGSQGNGFIRRAIEVIQAGKSLQVRTERGTLLDAVESADITLQFGPGAQLEDTTGKSSAGDTRNESGDIGEIMLDVEESQSPLQVSGHQLGERKFNLLEENAQFFRELNREFDHPLIGEIGNGLWLEGRVSTALDFDFTLKIREGKLVSSESDFKGEVQGSLTLVAKSILALEASKDILIASLRPVRVVGSVGFIPFVVTLTPELVLNASGRVGTSASLFTARLSVGSEGAAKVLYEADEDRWQGQYELPSAAFDATADVQGANITNTLSASIALVPQVNVQFYESSGARLKLPLTVTATLESDQSEECANLGLDVTASVLLAPESRWDWINGLNQLDEIELVETNLASANLTPCGERGGNDPGRLDGGTSSVDGSEQPPVATTPKCPVFTAWPIGDAEGDFTLTVNGESQSLQLAPNLDFGSQFLTSVAVADQHALCAEVHYRGVSYGADGSTVPASTLFNYEAILVDASGTPRANLSSRGIVGGLITPGIGLSLEVATRVVDEYVTLASFEDGVDISHEGSVSVEVDQPACGGDYVLLLDNLPFSGGRYFSAAESRFRSNGREEPNITLSGRLRFKLPDVGELNNTDVQSLSDCGESNVAVFDVRSSDTSVFPFSEHCFSGREQTFFNFGEWVLLSFKAEPVNVEYQSVLRTDLWEITAEIPRRVTPNQVLTLATVATDGSPAPSVDDGVAYMSLGYDGDGMAGLDWRATSGQITIDIAEPGESGLDPFKRLSARFEATFERISNCPTIPDAARGPVTVTGRIEVDNPD